MIHSPDASEIDHFFRSPILNNPYEIPNRHWELDATGQPTHKIIEKRRESKYLSPIPKPKRQKGKATQGTLDLPDTQGISTKDQRYDATPVINELRNEIAQWRALRDPAQWLVTPETARLLQHWRTHQFQSVRPFFCQVEAVETAIWLTEVASQSGARGKRFLDHLIQANKEANPDLARLALKLATGAGKTTVMAMLIAWQTVNAVRRSGSNKFTKGFLIVAPGLTIKDRLRVLQPNDPDSYYQSRELVPPDLLPDLGKARIVITNYHAFKFRETLELARGTRQLLQGHGSALDTTESDGQMIQRVMPELMALKNIMVLNDEAHHCYREKVKSEAEDDSEQPLTADDREEAERNREAARLWINGLSAVQRTLGIGRVLDLSATPFFLRGSGYTEGTLFHWTMSDFSLMDAIESGIVKLPRVPVSDNIANKEVPIFRNLWENIRKEMPKKGRGKGGDPDPLKIPIKLQTALEVLYNHYAKTYDEWMSKDAPVPPCFIVVCNNTSASKLVYDYISGFNAPDGTLHNGRLELFRNFDEHGQPHPHARTILIDSEQLESGEIDPSFRSTFEAEIKHFHYERSQRPNYNPSEKIDDVELLREVMNTVGKTGRLGANIRCVVSVSMLTEGWDANTVTHVLGVRAFGTQLLCEQVIGRALRRASYDLNPETNTFDVEYADILGIPFDFTAEPVVSPVQAFRETVQVRAVRPERDHLEIRFPRVTGYRIELPEQRIEAEFTADSVLELTPELIGPTKTKNEGIIGEGIDLTVTPIEDQRPSAVLFHLTKHLLANFRNANEASNYHLFGQLKRVAKEWIDGYLVCKSGATPGHLLYIQLAKLAVQRINDAINRKGVSTHGQSVIKAVLDPYNPTGSTNHVHFTTSKTDRYQTDPRKSHINWVVLDSGWESEFCRVAESHQRVRSYVKNHSLGFEIPYLCGSETRQYRPDFIVQLENGINLIVEIKGFRNEDAKDKKAYIETYWLPGINANGAYGRWAFTELRDPFTIESDFNAFVASLRETF